jgi:hypothetical protein
MEMKVAIVRVFVCASMLLLSAVANPQITSRAECTDAILNGSYGVLQDGVVFGEGGHLAEAAVVQFDGKGRWTLEGTLVSTHGGLRGTSVGRYTVTADCRGSASLETPFGTADWEFVIVGDGNEVLQIATTPPRGGILWALTKQFSK